jgi:putative ABC transport system substrate-binding protein
MIKNTAKLLISLTVAIAMVLSLTGCASTPAAGKTLKIGVIQYAPHPSLDNCYEGFVQGLASGGYVDGQNITIDFQNAQGEMNNSDTMAKNMAVSGYDMLIGIATPAAMSAYAAAKESGIPVVFSAVSDPVAAKLVETMENPGSGATGTSDALNLEGQIKMIRAFLPEAKSIGILYTTGEPNSVSNLRAFRELAPGYGFTVVEQGITGANEVATGAASLIGMGVDCINNFTDNNVVNNLSVLLHAADSAGIPVFGSEIEQVKNGCVASESLDYVALGVKTGQMAADILSDKADINTIPVAVITDSEPVYSAVNCEKFGINIPDAYATARNIDE